jgi:hypothetical protein
MAPRTRKLAESGNAAAQFLMACRYWRGIGVKESPEDALYWIEQSAGQGFPQAQNYLGVNFCHGGFGEIYMPLAHGSPKSPVQAVNWFRLAAVQGLPDAQLNFAQMYECGFGVNESAEASAKWYKYASPNRSWTFSSKGLPKINSTRIPFATCCLEFETPSQGWELRQPKQTWNVIS